MLPSPKSLLTWITLLFCSALVLSGCSRETPSTAYQAIANSAAKGDWNSVYDRFDADSKTELDFTMLAVVTGALLEAPKAQAKKYEALKLLKGKELFVQTYQTIPGAGDWLMNYIITGEKVTGDRATLVVVSEENKQQKIVKMHKEDGVWKLSL